MIDSVTEPLILDLLEWVSRKSERTYEEVMEAWRTSCPKLPVWEDANDRGLLETEFANGRSIVRVTPAGQALLAQCRPAAFSKTSFIPERDRGVNPDRPPGRNPARQQSDAAQQHGNTCEDRRLDSSDAP